MTVLFVDRNPNTNEIAKLRLLLSTYQDGSGMLVLPDGTNLPGWRDFERSVAVAFGGQAQENKAVFDVLLPNLRANEPARNYGISCKMRGTLNEMSRSGRVTIELSNSASKFWTYLQTKGITHDNWKQKAALAGAALVELLEEWHEIEGRQKSVDLAQSSYLMLSWSLPGTGRSPSRQTARYQLHRFPMTFPPPEMIEWSVPTKKTRQGEVIAGRLVGKDATGTLFEWYGESGGQLKYYPSIDTATWQSDVFELEPIPPTSIGLLNKAKMLFPKQWPQESSDEK